MHKYTYALSYFDEAFKTASFRSVEIIAETELLAERRITESKENHEWLKAAFDADDSADLEGIIIGDHLLLTQEVVATFDADSTR